MPENIHLFARLTKVDPIQGLAYGTAAAEEPDKSGEIFDYASSKPNFEAWSDGIAKATAGKSLGNVRAMHGSVAAGKLTTISFDDANKRIEVCAKIVDKAELEKLVEGVYTGFSIGGKYAKRWPDEGDKKLTRYTALPSELSIVDNPCIPTATFACVKGDGTEEMRKFHAPTTEPAPAAMSRPPSSRRSGRRRTARRSARRPTPSSTTRRSRRLPTPTRRRPASSPPRSTYSRWPSRSSAIRRT